jgi:isopentenyldiphosphate isomerase
MTDSRELDIIDSDDNIIGIRSREDIHNEGLLHREIHVWFYTPQGELVFQHRAKDKDTYPDLLDGTVGGHVEIGSDYEQTAVQESFEETGLIVNKSDLSFIQMQHSHAFDVLTNKTNNALRAIYAYLFTGKIEDLVIEEGKALGFELWSFETIFNIEELDRSRFIPFVFSPTELSIYEKIHALI